VLRSTTSGTVTSYTQGLPPDASPLGITSGPDDNLWVTDRADPRHVMRIGAGDCAVSTPSAPVPVAAVPTFTG
jgi:streptogramin lyase